MVKKYLSFLAVLTSTSGLTSSVVAWSYRQENDNFFTVNQPDETIENGNYLLYSNPINFTFNWKILASVSITHNASPFPVTNVITSGSYQIKDDGNYKVTFRLKNGTVVQKDFFLKTNYDFSHGIDGAIWNPSTRMLDIYFNQTTAYLLTHFWYNHPENLYLLDWIRELPSPFCETWKNLFAPNDYLDATIDYFIPKPPFSEHKGLWMNTYDLLDQEITYPLMGDSETPVNYGEGLQNKIDSLQPTKGLVFKLNINLSRMIKTVNNPTLGQLFAKPTTSGGRSIYYDNIDFVTNYWDKVLFNQN